MSELVSAQGAVKAASRWASLDLPELYQCVHCGLCLNHCPTYRDLRLETESPRGRIHLVKALADGRISLTPRFAEHIYLCLICRACETACPAGVQFGRIAEAARAAIGPPGSGAGRFLTRLFLNAILPFPHRLRLLIRALRFLQRSGLVALGRVFLPKRLWEAQSMLPPIPRHFFDPPEVLPAMGNRRARVAFLSGCVMSTLFSDVNEATVRVLQRNGCEVVIPRNQGCCGALNAHNGEVEAAKAMARRNIDAFLATGADYVLTNAAGCGAAMKEYGHLLADDPAYVHKAMEFARKVRDVTEFLAEIGLNPPPGHVPLRVTYQDPCHLAHGQRVRAQPRALLRAIPGIELVEMEASDRCCGSAGIYNLTQPEMSRRLLEEKVANIQRTGAQAVVAPNPGCMLQIRYGLKRAGLEMPVYHLLDLMDQAYQERL
ncbi:MAG: (Fe-S)-binding protein [Armatimonadota bacterium]|nr:(Fe-S)-binding protein [Armatimonadota bacterium]MDR5703224.1 (Fe-S)-binding protein [Armatimonadota bacterium]MDR7434022.1 (Fe-S)-binding protein [Armatimonadota bacterium]